MATVTGVTAARANAIEAASVVGASIQGNDLVLVTHGGTQINVGRIIPPLVDKYPVGTIYFTDRSANPSTYMGGGTWVRWGKGRVPVGIDEADAAFSANGAEGGQKTYAMTMNEMPAHNHNGNTGYQSHDHTHQVPVGYKESEPRSWQYQDGGTQNLRTFTIDAVAQSYGVSQNHYHSIASQGGGTPVANNNLQPYITCYVWKRTA